jgi:hypothetical protein
MVVWASLCSFVSTLLRNSAAAAMLAGYMLIIIASTSIPAPEHVFEIAVSRASEICIGIVCATLLIALTDLESSPRRLSELLSQLIAETARHLADVLATGGTQYEEGPEVRRALIARTGPQALCWIACRRTGSQYSMTGLRCRNWPYLAAATFGSSAILSAKNA